MESQIVRVELPPDNIIAGKGKFIVKDMIPLAISNTTFPNQFMVLFFVHQDFDDICKYIQILITTDSPDVFNNNRMNITNIHRSQEVFETYKRLMARYDKTNIYGTDLDLIASVDNPLYYYCLGTRAISRSNAEEVELYFPRNMYISLNLFLSDLLKDGEFNTTYFLNPLYNSIKFITIEQSKYDASCRIVDKPEKNMNEIYSHYTMNCGPSEFRMNYISLELVEKNTDPLKLSNPMRDDMYKIYYSEDPYVQNVFYDRVEDCAYIIYFRKEDTKVKSYALKLPNKIYSNTNFVDGYNKIYTIKEK